MKNGSETVLVVDRDPAERNRIGTLLEGAGFEVMVCPGPRSPDFTCIAGRGGACPLAEGADVVVLNLRLESDDMMLGMPSWQLLAYYDGLGKRIVALSGAGDVTPDITGVAVLPRRPDGAELIRAIRESVIDVDSFRPARSGAQPGEG